MAMTGRYLSTTPVEIRPAQDFLDELADEYATVPAGTPEALTLPCCRGETACLAIAQWDGLPRTEEGDPAVDVIHATHQFAYVPSLVQSCTVVFDEQPDFSVGDRLSTERIQRAVTAFLRAAEAPVTTWEAFVQLARAAGRENVHGDVAREAQATVDAFAHQPDQSWYFETPDAHTLAPVLAEAVWQALTDSFDTNGRAVGRDSQITGTLFQTARHASDMVPTSIHLHDRLPSRVPPNPSGSDDR